VTTSGGTPRGRVGNARDFLEFLEARSPGIEAHLRATLPAGVMEAIRERSRNDWIEVATVDGPYVTGIVSHLGPDEAREAWRRFTSQRLVRSPALHALVDGAVRLFGLSVATALRVFPRAFEQGFRDVAETSVAFGDREATLEMRLAPEYARFEAYAVELHGVFLGLYDFTRTEPRLEYEPDLGARRVRARFRW
jgi:hypothetical protein